MTVLAPTRAKTVSLNQIRFQVLYSLNAIRRNVGRLHKAAQLSMESVWLDCKRAL
jgi:hypothetical protein